MPFSLRLRLSAMMFLQYAIWGAWAPVLSEYLLGDPSQQAGLGFTGQQVGHIYALLPIACIISPFIGGQIADRWVPTQWFLAAAHLLAAGALYMLAFQTAFPPFALWMLIYALLYAPTLALTNSLAFHHLRNAEKDFGGIRVFGTLGWIVAGLALAAWRHSSLPKFVDTSDCLLLAVGASVVMGLIALTLPHTPPSKSENPWAFLAAVKLLGNRQFLIFMLISFVVVTELQFYYLLTAPFLVSTNITTQQSVSAVMTTAQWAEVLGLAVLLPLLLPRLGVRNCLAIGVIAWPIRYLIFALGKPALLVIASLAMHGLGYTFFFVVGQVYVNSVATSDIRASAQSLLTLITLGVGNFLGAEFTGWIKDHFTATTGAAAGATNWTSVFLVPCALTVTCAIAFLLFFRETKVAKVAA